MGGRPMVYCSTPGIAWVKDAELTLLVHEETGRWWELRGLEAAVWDFLTLSYSFPRLVRVVSLLTHQGEPEAAAVVAALLRRWADEGLVCVGEDAQDG